MARRTWALVIVAAGALPGACAEGTGLEEAGAAGDGGAPTTTSAGPGGAGGEGGAGGTACTPSSWFMDADGDGYGDDATATFLCPQPPGHVAQAGDCDDTNANVNPAAAELCNGIDDDCVDGDDITACAPGCAPLVNQANGHSYTFCSTVVAFGQASAACVGMGMRLVRLDDSPERLFVLQQAAAAGFSGLWIGASDQVTEGTWVWEDGDQFWSGGSGGMAVGGLYEAWQSGEPNDDGTEDCAAMNAAGEWIDTECSNNRASVCEQY